MPKEIIDPAEAPVVQPPVQKLSWIQPIEVRDKLESKAWTSGRVEAAKKSLNNNIGTDSLIPPTPFEQEKRLSTWWQQEGQFIPRNVLDQLGIVGGERVPTLKESIDLENKQKVNVVKDFLGIERQVNKDPLDDILIPPEPTEFADPDAPAEPVELDQKMSDIIKAASVDDLKVVNDAIISNPMGFQEGLGKEVTDEIKIKETIPDVIKVINDKPTVWVNGTAFFNTLTRGLSEFSSRKGFSPTEALLDLPQGSESIWIRSVARVREQLVAEDPTLLNRLKFSVGEIGAELIWFVALPDPSKAKAFVSLSKGAKAALGVGSKAGMLELLRAPEVGETLEERAEKIRNATGIGAVTGVVLQKAITFIKDIPISRQAAVLAEKMPQVTKQQWVGILKVAREGNLLSLKVEPRIPTVRRLAPAGFRPGFAEIQKPAEAAIKATKVASKGLAKTKEAITIQAAKAVLAIKVQPSKAVKPTKVITRVEAESLKEIGAIGEGEKLRIVANPQLKKSIQAAENQIATLKTRRNELLAEKQFAVAKTKAQEIAKKEIALADMKEKAGIKLEQTIEGSKEKIQKIKGATEFKEELRNDAISMVTSIESGLRKDFIIRANKVKTVKALQKLTAEVENGIQKFEKKAAISELGDTIGKVKASVNDLPSPQREKLEATLDSISTKRISKKALDPEEVPREPGDLDVKARKGRTQLLGDDLVSLQRTTQKLASELAGQLEALEPEVEEALRIPNERVRQLNLLTQKNAHEISVEDIKFINESLQNTLHEGKLKGKLLTRKGLKPLEGVLHKAPKEIRPTGKVIRTGKKVAAGKSIKSKKSPIEKAIGGTNKLAHLDELHMDTLVELMTNADAPGTTLILDTNPHKGLRETAEIFKAWQTVSIEEFNKAGFTDIDQILGKHTVTLAGVTLKDVTLSELMSLEMDTRSPDNLLQRLNSEGIQVGDRKSLIYEKDAHGEDVVDRLKEINDAVAIVRADKIAMALLDFTERMTPVQAATVNETAKLRFGYEVAREENYYPRSRVGEQRVSGAKGKISIPPEKAGRYQIRTGGDKPLRLRPWHEVFLGGLESDAAFSGMTIPLRNARLLLTDKAFVDAVNAAGRQAELNNIIEIFSNTQGVTSSKDIVDVYGRRILKARTTSALGFRVSTRGTQVLSFYAAQAITGNQGAVLISVIKDNEVINIIKEDSAPMALRWQSRRVGIEIGTNASSDAFSLLFFGQTKSLANIGMKGLVDKDQLAIQNIYKKLVRPELLSEPRNGKNINVFEWEGTDNVADLPKMTDILSPEFRYAAARRLEYTVRKSQPMFDMLDRSVSMASTNVIRRSFMMFRTAFNAMQNIVARAFIQFQKGQIGKAILAQKLGAVGASLLAVALWKRGLKWAIGTSYSKVLEAFGIFRFIEPKEKKETIKDIGIDTAKGISALNPFTRIVASVAEIAADKIAGNNYPWGREPVDNPILEVLNSGGDAAINVAQAFADISLWDNFVAEETKADIEHNEKLAKKLSKDFERVIKSSWDFGTTITGVPLQAPVQEWVKPLFKDSDIKIIREVTFGDVENPQKFSEGVFKLYERRKEIKKKERTTRLSGNEEVVLKVLDNFVSSMNKQAGILKETQEHSLRKIGFSDVELKVNAVTNHLKLVDEVNKK